MIESDHVKRDEIEFVSATNDDGADEDSIDIDYEGSTSESTNIEHSFSSSSTEFAHIDKCRGDDAVSCPKNPHIRICEVQFCDQINDCPDNEDELNCPTFGGM